MIGSAEEFVALRMSEDPEEYSRAAHEDATEEVWLDVISRFPDMRFWVAHNKTVPLSVLCVLSEDPDPKVREMVASKGKADEPLLRKLARDPHGSVRSAVAHNKKASPSVLRMLSDDEWSVVAEAVRARMQSGGG